MELGIRVVRGPDWKWQNQDGGEGHLGTVVEIGRLRSDCTPNKTVVVLWDCAFRSNYRVGYQGAYDLRVFDSGTIGVKHPLVTCRACHTVGIAGHRWQCAKCRDYSLCQACYHGDKHEVGHPFLRFDAPGRPGVKVPKRMDAKKLEARGIFPSAKVLRGPDWDWGNQDGGPGKEGRVVEIRDWEKESCRSVANVRWLSSVNNVYRLGHKGKVDLKCVQAASGGYYYPHHLPVLGENHNDKSAHSTRSTFKVGDRIRVDLEVDILKQMQEGHGGWNPRMAEYIGKVGCVHRITERGDVRVQYEGCNNRWTFHAGALTHLGDKRLNVGDTVIISDNVQHVRDLQKGHGEWTETMISALGRRGKVVRVYADGDVRVMVVDGGDTWTFSPACCTLANSRRLSSTHSSPPASPRRSRLGSADDRTKDDRMNVRTNDRTSDRTNEQANDRTNDETNDQTDVWTNDQTVDENSDRTNDRTNASADDSILQPSETPISNVVNAQTVDAPVFRSRTPSRQTSDTGSDLLQFDTNSRTSDVSSDLIQLGAHSRTSSALSEDLSETFTSEAAQLECEVNVDVCEVTVKKNSQSACAVGRSPLHLASHLGGVDQVRALLTDDNVNLHDEDGDTPLHYSVFGNQPTVAELLLERGAHVNAVNNAGCTSLAVAVHRQHALCVQVLLDHAADVNMQDSYGDTALHDAIRKENRPIISMLCAKDDAQFVVCNKKGFNALHQAALQGQQIAIEKILRRAPHIVDVKKDDGFVCLHLAALNGHVDVINTLLNVGKASVDVVNHAGQTALNLATRRGHAGVIETLVAKGANVNSQDEDGNTCLHLVLNKRIKIQPLQQAPAIAAIQTELANSSVADSSVVAIACYLAKFGAKLDVKNAEGHTPLHAIAGQSAEQVIRDYAKVSLVEHIDCLVCSDNAANMIFEPCGHRNVCSVCCVRMKRCLACQQTITKKTMAEGILPLPPSNDAAAAAADATSSSARLAEIEAKMRMMEDSVNCSICLDSLRKVVFLCGHGACAECARSLQVCHMCRRPITQRINLFT